MNSSNNVSVLQDISRYVPGGLTTPSMQSSPAVGFPTTHGSDPAAAQSLYPQSYNLPTYDAGAGLTNPYARENVFTAPTSSSSGIPLGISDLTPSLFGSSVLSSNPYHPTPHPLHLPQRTTPSLLNYGQPPIQPHTQNPLFPSPSPYSRYASPLPMGLPPNQPGYLLSSPHMMSRFPSLHPRGPSSLANYGVSADGALRPPFTSSLLAGPTDRKGLGMTSSPAANMSNGAEMDHRTEVSNSRKKRKACGHCGPCQRKENCGSCMNCVNRAKGKQICIHRKCEVLKKKPGSTPYIPTPEPTTKLEKRKEVDDFVSTDPKRNKIDDAATGDLPQGLIHPTLHPNFSEFGDTSRDPSRFSGGQLVDKSQSSGSHPDSQIDNPPFFPGEQPPAPHSFHSGDFPSGNRAPSSEPNVSSGAAGSENDQADFINQALQALEGDSAPASSSPSALGYAADSAAPPPSQATSSAQSLPQAQLGRRSSRNEGGFKWSSQDKANSSLAPEGLQIPPGKVPPTGPVSSERIPESEPLPDQLLSNLRKYNSGTNFHGQSGPYKDPGNPPPYSPLPPPQPKSYATPGLPSTTIAEGGPQNLLNTSRASAFSVGQNAPDSRQSEPGSNPDGMYQPQISPYAGQASLVSADPNCTNIMPGAYNPVSHAYITSNPPAFPAPSSEVMGRPFRDPTFPGNAMDPASNHSAPIDRFTRYVSNPSQNPPGGYEKPGVSGAELVGPDPYQFPLQQQLQAEQSQYQQLQPPFRQPISRSPFGQAVDQHRLPGSMHRNPPPPPHDGPLPAGAAPRMPNGSAWGYRTIQPHSQVPGGGPIPTLTSPPDVAQQRPPAYETATRRMSSNMPGEFFPPSARHVSDQPLSNGSGSCSPMVQSSPVGSSVVANSPFAGSVGNSLRSPASALVAGSPALQYQVNVSSPSSANLSHSSASPNILPPPRGPPPGVLNPAERVDPALAPNAQKYRPWHEHQTVPLPGLPPEQGVPAMKSDPSCPTPISTANHFLVQPGSSHLNMSPAHPPNAAAANVVIGGPRPSREGPAVDGASFAAARLSIPDKAQNDGDPRRFLYPYTSEAQREFTHTMNSVLYGKTGAEQRASPADVARAAAASHRKNSSVAAASSPTDAHATISPGESGYDSAELSSVLSEASHQTSSGGTTAFQSKDSESLSVSIEGALPVDEAAPSQLPKNALAASAGYDQRRTGRFATSQDEFARHSQPMTGSANPCSSPAEAASPALQPDLIQLQPPSVKLLPAELPQKTGLAGPVDRSLPTVVSQSATDPTANRSSGAAMATFRQHTYHELAPGVAALQPAQALSQCDRYYDFGPGCGATSFLELLGAGPGCVSLAVNEQPPDIPKQVQAHHHHPTDHSARSASQLYAPVQMTPLRTRCPVTAIETPPLTPHGESHRKCAADVPPSPSIAPVPDACISLPTPPHTNDDQSQTVPASGDDPPSMPCLTSDTLRGHVTTCRGPKNTTIKKLVFPQCSCLKDSNKPADDAPYYTHLGAAPTVAGIRELFERRCGVVGRALRIEKVKYTGKEGKTEHGCPVAKWVLRRSSEEEKVMVVCRKRPGHRCATAVVVLIVMLWEGVDRQVADDVYGKFTQLIPANGTATQRRCGTNAERTCACQGFDDDTGGASFSFGCSWSMYYNCCKYARSNNPSKFKLTGTKNGQAEAMVEDVCQRLATSMSKLYKAAAPDAHQNQVEFEEQGKECRLGHNDPFEGRPFSGVTLCMDFCAHAHKDQHNMDNGSTVVLTLTKPELRIIGGKPTEDEQLHVLPLYKLDLENEDGTFEGVRAKLDSGAIEILSGFRREVRLRDKPLETCKKREKLKRGEAGGDGGSPKKRGRKPKKCKSLDGASAHYSTQEPFPELQYDQPVRFPRRSSLVSFSRPPFDPLCSPPPRWPYRRHPPKSPSPIQSNLPSIGSFLPGAHSPVAAPLPNFTPPLTPGGPRHISSPSYFGQRLSSSSPGPPNNASSPGIDSNAPTRPTPAASSERRASKQSPPVEVKRESHCDVDCFPDSRPSHEHTIKLSAYAAGMSPRSASRSPLVKEEPRAVLEQPCKAQQQFMSDSKENFYDSEVGGVAIAPGHGSVLIECAKRELHATTSLLRPNRFHPSRVSMVFYQHKNMNYRNHGAAEYEEKEMNKRLEKAEKSERKAEELRAVRMHQEQAVKETCPGGAIPGAFLAEHSPRWFDRVQLFRPGLAPSTVVNTGVSSSPNPFIRNAPSPLVGPLLNAGVSAPRIPFPGPVPDGPRTVHSHLWYRPDHVCAVPHGGVGPRITVDIARRPDSDRIVNDPYRPLAAPPPLTERPQLMTSAGCYPYQQPTPNFLPRQAPPALPYCHPPFPDPRRHSLPGRAPPSAPPQPNFMPSSGSFDSLHKFSAPLQYGGTSRA